MMPDIERDFMGIFGGGGSVKTPKVQAPTPLPAAPVATNDSADAEIKKVKRRTGFEKSILTGVMDDNKLTTLG